MGISVGAHVVRAVLLQAGRIVWAGQAAHESGDDLAEVIARLASEGNGIARPRVARVVLERQMVQLRTFAPAPRLRLAAARQWVALEAPRLFRKNGAPLATDVMHVKLVPRSVALWAAAAPEPLLETILAGCAGAGLSVREVGVSADVVSGAVLRPVPSLEIVNGTTSESVEMSNTGAWRSRLRRRAPAGSSDVGWITPLAVLGEEASHFAAAFGAAVKEPRLALVPYRVRRERDRDARRRILRLGLLTLAVWMLAAAVHVLRLSLTLRSSLTFVEAARGSVDSLVHARRDLTAARTALATVQAAELSRSNHSALLATLVMELPDSAFLLSWQVAPEGTVRLVGYAPMAVRVVAALHQVRALHEPRIEGSVTQEVVRGIGQLDRFEIVARLAKWP